MSMTGKQVASLDQQSNKGSFEPTTTTTTTTTSKEVDLKNTTNQSNVPNNTTNNATPYSTLSLRRKGKRGISQLGDDENNVHPTDDKESNEKRKECLSSFMVDTPEYTLILPDINSYSPDFRDFLKKDLLETSTLVSLELAGRLNWWVDLGICRRLFPLVTTGDGNCLLHAASLALTGQHDNRLVLRKALSKMMCQSPFKNAFLRRWRWHQTIINKQSELVFTEAEWLEEWSNLAKLASIQPRIPSQPSCDTFISSNGKQRPCEECDEMDEILYESLEELHVFILAHVLKRTIIIIADTILKNLNGEPLAPISFGGIYLPLECPPDECLKSPLLLTYDAAHFSALVPMEDNSDAANLADAVPLVDPDFELLPVHFAYDPGPSFQWSSLDDNFESGMQHQNELHSLKLLQSYMDVKFLEVPYAGEFDQKPDRHESDKDQITDDLKDKNNCGSQSESTALNFSGSAGNSSRTCSSQSSPEENSAESSKFIEDGEKLQNCTGNRKPANKSKKFSSFKKRIGRTLKMGFCASGIQQDLDEIDEHSEKRTNSFDGSRQFMKKAKSVEDNKGTKTFSPGNTKRNELNIKTDIKALRSAENSSSPEVKPNDACGKPHLNNSNSKQEAQSLTQLKCPDRVLCARLYHKRDEAQDRILKRYFTVAQDRFNQFKKEDKKENQNCSMTNCHLNPRQTSAGTLQTSSLHSHSNNANKTVTIQCINSGCLGTDACSETSYLCRECFERQKQEEMDLTIKMASHKHMQQQFVQPQPHYHTAHQSKYLTSITSPSSSSSTIHLPLIKNTPQPTSTSFGNSNFPGYKHTISFQHQQSNPHVFTNCYSKPASLIPPAKNHIINSSSGAAAFNKSFESNYKEDCVTSPTFSNSTNFNLHNSNKYNNSSMLSNRTGCSPVGTNSIDAPIGHYMREKFKHFQPIDSPLPTMYASEEDDDEEEEEDDDGDGVVEEGEIEKKFTIGLSPKVSHVKDFHSKINKSEAANASTVLKKNSQKFMEGPANRSLGTNTSRAWSNGFRSTSFDDKHCHSLPGVDNVSISPWVSKTSACKTEGCSFYGTANSDYFCSRCYKQNSAGHETNAIVTSGVLANKSIVL